MDPKTRKAIEQVLKDAERVYGPFTRAKKDETDDDDSPSWNETMNRMGTLKRSAAKLRKLLGGGATRPAPGEPGEQDA